jgi:hypothetical protein
MMDRDLKYSGTVCISTAFALYSVFHISDMIDSRREEYPSLYRRKNKGFLMALFLILPMTTTLKFIRFAGYGIKSNPN